MQTTQLRVRLNEQELSVLKGLADELELTPTAVAGLFIRAGVRAAQDAGNRLQLPLKFKILESEVQTRAEERPVKTRYQK